MISIEIPVDEPVCEHFDRIERDILPGFFLELIFCCIDDIIGKCPSFGIIPDGSSADANKGLRDDENPFIFSGTFLF